MLNVGKRIRNLRKDKGINSKELAEAVDLTQSHISKIEKGGSKPSLDALFRICQVLDISLSDFFATESIEMPAYKRELLQNAKSLTPEQTKLLNDFLKSLNVNNE